MRGQMEALRSTKIIATLVNPDSADPCAVILRLMRHAQLAQEAIGAATCQCRNGRTGSQDRSHGVGHVGPRPRVLSELQIAARSGMKTRN